jgi:hypothetical protein
MHDPQRGCFWICPIKLVCLRKEDTFFFFCVSLVLQVAAALSCYIFLVICLLPCKSLYLIARLRHGMMITRYYHQQPLPFLQVCSLENEPYSWMDMSISIHDFWIIFSMLIYWYTGNLHTKFCQEMFDNLRIMGSQNHVQKLYISCIF